MSELKRYLAYIAAPFGVAVAIIALYVADSVSGGYWMIPETVRGYNGNIVYNIFVAWQPKYGFKQATDGDALGKLLSPFIAIDRVYFHKTYDISQPRQEAQVRALPSRLWHPNFRKFATIKNPSYCAWEATYTNGDKRAYAYKLRATDGKLSVYSYLLPSGQKTNINERVLLPVKLKLSNPDSLTYDVRLPDGEVRSEEMKFDEIPKDQATLRAVVRIADAQPDVLYFRRLDLQP